MAYTASDKVKEKEKDYYAHLYNNDPGEFSSANTEKANKALSDYENRGEFKYNPATDSGYQAAKKQYTQGGKQAMKDTLGTATELTGGYDNSYANVAAQQTYNNYMSELSSLMPQYEQQAYDRWQDEGERKLNYYGVLKDAEADEYSKYRDKVSDYNTEADRLYGLYADEKNFEYGSYWDQVNQDYQAEQDRIANDQWERNFAESQRQYNANLAEEQRQYNTNLAESKRQYNTNLAESKRQYDTTLAENQRQYNATLAASGEGEEGYPEITDDIYDEFVEAYKSSPEGMAKVAEKYETSGYDPEELTLIMESVMRAYEE